MDWWVIKCIKKKIKTGFPQCSYNMNGQLGKKLVKCDNYLIVEIIGKA